MKQLSRFLRNHKLFSLAIVTIIIGLMLVSLDMKTAAKWTVSTVSIIAILPLVLDMWRNVRAGSYGIDILAITAVVASVILGEYWAAIVVVLMLTGGEALEDHAEHRARTELDALLAKAPQKARIIRKGKTLEVKASEVNVGDKLVIKAGELVAADAMVIAGAADFNESSLTGESTPRHKQVGDTLMSGSVNLDGEITAKVTATSEDSQYQQIISLVKGAAASQAPFVRLAERYSLPFTFAAYAVAVAVWVVTGDAKRFLEVIIVATPCPLLLAAPIALMSGMSRASKYGIIVKTGSALEKLADAETIAFDKTGTLTYGTLSVDAVQAFSGHTKEEVLRTTASLEQSSSHIIGASIIAHAQTQNIKLLKAKHVRELAGRGLTAQLQGKQLIAGHLQLMHDEGVTIPASFKASSIKQTAVYLAIDGKLAGYITLQDTIREEADETLRILRKNGLKDMLLITGDTKASAAATAKQLGISEVHAEALPADKLRVLDGIKNRPLVFVGDGVNDAPILAGADVGIALGAHGSPAAAESADMVLMRDDISQVAAAHSIARRTFKIARQSIFTGIGLSMVLIAAFATGKFTPLTGALLQEVVDVVVILNALRARRINL